MTTRRLSSTGRAGAQELPLPGDPADVWLPWLLRLRWIAVAGQLGVLAAARLGFEANVAATPILALIAVLAASNLALSLAQPMLRRRPRLVLAGVQVVDVLLLTAVLHFSGGPLNPFSVLYLVNVSLAALCLGVRFALAIAALAALGYALLFAGPGHAAGAHAFHGDEGFTLHLVGMWAATAITAALLGYFVSRIAGALHEREERLRTLEAVSARRDKLFALSTLAAGAAHELGTPLATIGVAAGELARKLEGRGLDPGLAADARLICEEVGRCRDVLGRLRGEAGEAAGEAPQPTRLPELLESVRDALREGERERVSVSTPSECPSVCVPRTALVQALLSLVRNALLSGPETSRVWLRADARDGHLSFEVEDRGEGMAPEVLARAGEPFFTTRAPGAGMGLGIFLAQSVAEQIGGELVLESTPGIGTRVRLELPAPTAEASR